MVSGGYLVIVDGTEAEIMLTEEILKHKEIRNWGVYNSPEPNNYLEPVVTQQFSV